MASTTQREGGVLGLGWYRSLSENGVHAFWAGAAGWALNAFDLIALTSVLGAITATFGGSAVRGVTYNFGRAVGAFFPATIGFLAASIGLTAAIVFGTAAHGLALVSLLFLPETKGKELVALD